MVRLLHNNYHVDRTGKRYFDQGFHVQSEYLSNTRAEQAIEAIATYSFDMHSQFAAEQKERITYYQKQTHQTSSSEPSDKRDKKEHISLFKRIKEKFISKADKKPSDKDNLISLKIDEFNLVSEKGYPRDGDRCIYIWRTRENDIRWQVGIYDRTQHAFFITFGESTFITDKNKVIAWKRINSGEGISGLNQGNAD
jgi:nitrous oxide reductase